MRIHDASSLGASCQDRWLQAVRDENLNITHRNDIGEKRGTML